MCGICGIANLNSGEPVDRSVLVRMTRTLSHRGPNDEGFFFEGGVGLGHRRLSIIDLAGGKQPIYNEDESCVIVFNGEVYNFADLTRDLAARGHRFRTRSDTEAIVHAYEQFGESCVERLRGMFAFAIWDRRERRLLLARDRLGIKPLYYYRNEDFLVFASEIKALLQMPGVPRTLDPEALDLYFSLRYVPGPRTGFKEIYKLQPGHILVVEDGAVRVRKYWDIDYQEPLSARPEAAVDEFSGLLEESVRLRLIAEVPLGLFLSGGLDSSSILAVMSKIAGKDRVKTFSVGYETAQSGEEDSNELGYARLAAASFGAEHHEYRLRAAEFCDFIPDLVWHLDEPMADPTCIPLYFISRVAREHITVILSGEGADEILAGYNIYRRMLALEKLQRAALGPGAPLVAALARALPSEAARHYLDLALRPLERRYTGVSRGFRPELKDELFGANGWSSPENELAAVFGPYFEHAKDAAPLDRMLYVDCKTWLADDLLLKADRMTMANGIELRVPFLDHRLVEFAARLPVGLKLNRGAGKFLLRRAMHDRLPPAILTRPKKGFPTPTGSWLRGPLRDMVRDVILRPNSACRLFFNPRALERVIRESEGGKLDRHQEIWSLLVFEHWHAQFLGGRQLREQPRCQILAGT